MVLDKTLKGIHGVRLDNRKVFHASGSRTKYFERLFLSFNKLYIHKKQTNLKFIIKI